MKQYKEQGYFHHNGNAYDINKIFKITEKKPIHQYNVADLKWILKYTKTYKNRISTANLDVPIVVTKFQNKLLIVDGAHRLSKAIKERRRSLPGKYITSQELESTKLKQVPRRRNPGGIIAGIKYFIAFKTSPYLAKVSKQTAEDWEFVTHRDFEYKFLRLISDFAKILNIKFKSIVPKCPVIVITYEDADFLKEIKITKQELRQFSNSAAIYDIEQNIIILNSKYMYDNIVARDNETQYNHNFLLRILFHELGHFIYFKYLDQNALTYFDNYIYNNLRSVRVTELQKKIYGLLDQQVRIKFPQTYVVIKSMEHAVGKQYDLNAILNEYRELYGDKYNVFSKPVSAIMPHVKIKGDVQNLAIEIFAEMFANYMMYDKRMLGDENYRILKTVIPELR